MILNQNIIKYETNNNERIQINKFQLWNQSNVNLRIVFLNKAINDGKDSYYKMYIWPKENNIKSLSNFLFSLQLKTTSGLETIQADIPNEYIINDDNPIIFKIPKSYIQNNLIFFYDFTHDSFEGKGEIDIDLSLSNSQKIDNELLMFDNGNNIPLIDKQLMWDIPEFCTNKKYKTIAKVKVNVEDLNLWKYSNIKSISEMGEIIKNNILDDQVTINSFNLSVNGEEAAKYYDFTPDIEIIKDGQYFDIDVKNCLELNSSTGIVDDTGDEQGFLFNINCKSSQSITLKININSTEISKTLDFSPYKISYETFDDENLITYKIEIL